MPADPRHGLPGPLGWAGLVVLAFALVAFTVLLVRDRLSAAEILSFLTVVLGALTGTSALKARAETKRAEEETHREQ